MSHTSAGKTTVTLNTMGGLVTYADADSLPAGASPRCHDVDFSVGGVRSRLGTVSQYTFAGNTDTNPGSLATSAQWQNTQNAFGTVAYATSTGTASGNIDITQFAYATSASVQTIAVLINTMSGIQGTTWTAQLIEDGNPIGTAKSITGSGALTFGGTDLWGASPNINALTFGVRISATNPSALNTFYLNSVSIEVSLSKSSSNFQYVKTFEQTNGTISTLALDATGEMWIENLSTQENVLNPLLTGIKAGSYADSTTANDREYIAFTDLITGSDLPAQYNGQWTDRITQVGPGAPPVFTPQAYTGDQYAISTITQPTGHTQGYAYYLQSQGPGSTAAGNVVTMYYLDGTTVSGPDADLVAAVNSGYAVYALVSFTSAGGGIGSINFGPQVVQITSVGEAKPPGQPHEYYYFTFQVTTSQYNYSLQSHSTNVVNYQRSLATLTASVPVPGLIPGNQITVSGSSVSGYNSQWTITQALNSGSVVITQTAVAGGVATFSYALSSGVAPVAGQQITISGTTNANGSLNGNNLVIASASGGTTGTFTINVSVADAPAASEEGLGVTAGTVFAFDPGAALNGSTTTSPIYGNATGGELIFTAGTQQVISAGTRQGVVFFGTRNAAETEPSTPIIFTIPANTSTILVSQVPIGPPDTLYRQISITEAGQLGQPGGNFYTIDDPVNYTVNGVAYTSTSFRINDNVSTTIALTFRDSDLLSARPIDQPGGDLFNQIEIGNPAWIVQYASRMFYGLTQQKIQNFVNLSFDGGYNPAAVNLPLGWTASGTGGSLVASPAFGNSYYIANTTGATATTLGLITQPAALDYYGAAILSPNTAYSVRVTARIPSGIGSGGLMISLTNSTQTVGSFEIPLSGLSEVYQTITGPLLASMATIPSGLLLNVQALGLPAGADVEIDRIEIFPTLTPVNTNRLLVSYADDPEGVDGDSGAIGTDSENTQPCYGAVVMYDLLYLLKDRSMYYTQDSSGDEPDGWGIHEVSNKAGACGIHAYDSGEEWIVMANRNGAYVFTGGEPQKISQEIQQVWDTINWAAARSIWVRNDVQERKLFIGVPLPTPNFWLPDATTNAAPAFPNVVLMCSYEGQSSGSAFMDATPVEGTYYGDLLADDLKRKWTIWQIPCPYADFITRANGEDDPLFFCNGIANSKIYDLTATNDDGAEIPWRYVTAGFGSDSDAKKYPALGNGVKRWAMWKARIVGSGIALLQMFQEALDAYVSTYNSYSIMLDTQGDLRGSSCNARGNLVYVDIESGGINSTFNLSSFQMIGTADAWSSDYVRS